MPETKSLYTLKNKLAQQVRADRHDKYAIPTDFSDLDCTFEFIDFLEHHDLVVEILDIQTGTELKSRDPEDAEDVSEGCVYERGADPLDDPEPISHQQLLDRVTENL